MKTSARVPATRKTGRFFLRAVACSALVVSAAAAVPAFARERAKPASAPEPAAEPAAATETPAPPSGTPGQGFGAQGQLAIDNDLGAGLTKWKGGSWTVAVQPAADVFVLPNLSVGLLLGYSHSSDQVTDLAARPRLGYALNFSDHFGVWPLVGVTILHETRGGASATGSQLNLALPIMIHIVPHLFFGIGPDYNLKISNALTYYGVTSMVGGWF